MTMSLPPLFRPVYREARDFAKNTEACVMSVSYTHLTLPTIHLV